MLDEKGTVKTETKEETYFSTWIDEHKTAEFKQSMEPIIKNFQTLEKEGYQITTTIDDRFDSDCFGERDVVKVLIHLKAIK